MGTHFFDRFYWHFKSGFFGGIQISKWGRLRSAPNPVERIHFRNVSLTQDPAKIEREYLTWIEMPKRVV